MGRIEARDCELAGCRPVCALFYSRHWSEKRDGSSMAGKFTAWEALCCYVRRKHRASAGQHEQENWILFFVSLYVCVVIINPKHHSLSTGGGLFHHFSPPDGGLRREREHTKKRKTRTHTHSNFMEEKANIKKGPNPFVNVCTGRKSVQFKCPAARSLLPADDHQPDKAGH